MRAIQCLEEGADPNYVVEDEPERGRPTYSFPLVAACKSGDLRIVKLLLDAGADPNLPDSRIGYFGDNTKTYPLNVAGGNLTMVELLRAHGAGDHGGDGAT